MAGRGKGGAGAGPSGSSQTQSQSFLPRKARQKYIRDVCQTPVISFDLKNHYKFKTNWEQLKKLQMGEDESNVEELGDIEAHTYCTQRASCQVQLWILDPYIRRFQSF